MRSIFILVCLTLFQACLGYNHGTIEGEPRQGSNVTINNRLYFISDDHLSHEESSLSCVAMGMKPLDLETEAENVPIKDYLIANVTGGDLFWTGGSRGSDMKWVWSTLVEFTYTNWVDGQPNETADPTACVYFNGAQGWFDYPCTILLRYMCEF